MPSDVEKDQNLLNHTTFYVIIYVCFTKAECLFHDNLRYLSSFSSKKWTVSSKVH